MPRSLLLVALLSWLVACAKAHAPTWTQDVEPIVQQQCNGCHAVGGIAPITLDSYLKAKVHGSDMVREVTAGRMPPWQPGPKSAKLNGERKLLPEEEALLREWVASGMEKGPDSAHRVLPPKTTTIRRDLDVSMAEPYTPPGDVSDDYRCFIIDPKATTTSLITGYEIHPGQPANVHHVILFEVLDQGTALADLQANDDRDPGPGYTCFGGPMVDTSAGGLDALPPIRFIGAWAPGEGAVKLPAHTGLPLAARSKLLMQVHYNLLNGRNEDLTTASLELTNKTPDLVEALLVPVPDGDFHIKAGDAHAAHSMTYKIPPVIPPLTIHSVYPHMHLLGKSISMAIIPAGQPELTLVDIPNWDFHWQGSYDLTTAVKVKPGDSLKISCTWDNSPDHQPELHGVKGFPKDVRWGEKTTDEMCLAFLYVTL